MHRGRLMTKLLTCFLRHDLTTRLPYFFQSITLAIAVLLMSVQTTNSAEADAPLIIQSQVKGSQEQPNVIYIMPWQGVDQIIEVKGKERTIKLPKFSPIHPEVFKEQVRFYANKQKAVQIDVAK